MKITRKAAKPVRIEMLPLIDIVFLLLVFFIYSMLSMAVHRGLHLDLPESSQAGLTQETPLTISVKSGATDMEIFVNTAPVLLSKLDTYLAQFLVSSSKSRNVLIFAEEEISYQQLFRVLDQVKKSGLQGISLQANPE